MRGRPEGSASASRAAVQKALKLYFAQNSGVSQSALAVRIGVPRQSIFAYLKGKASPSTETLAKLVSIPGLSIEIGNRRLRADDFPKRKSQSVSFQPWLVEPTTIESENRAVKATLKHGPEGTVRIVVELRAAN